MKRLFIVFFSLILLLNMFGCAQKSGDPVNNEVFTDEFFEDVADIRFGFYNEPLTGQQLAAVARYLKSLHLTHSEEVLVPEWDTTYGGVDLEYMYFVKADGTKLKIRVSQWAMSGLPSGSYSVTERGEKSILRSLWESCGRDPDAYPFSK